MKELTTEQKAKAYDDAIKRAEATLKVAQNQKEVHGCIVTIFPELYESEDERTRNEIIAFVEQSIHRGGGTPVPQEQEDRWITWLENQDDQKSILNIPSREVILSIWDLGNEWKELTNCSISTEYGTQLNYIQKHWHESECYLNSFKETQSEQKPADKAEPKFKVKDWIVDNSSGFVQQVLDFRSGIYTCTYNSFTTDCESNYHLWTIKDAKPGDILTGNKGDVILMFRGIGNTRWNDVIDYYCYYDYNRGDLVIQENIEYWGNIVNNQLEPATKEHRDTLFAKIKEAGYEWDDEKKELNKIEDEEYDGEDYGIDSLYHAQRILEKTLGKVNGYQSDDGILEHKCAITAIKKLYEQKPAEWSEEDEEFFNDTIDFFKNSKNALDHVDWLKSLKDRVQLQQKQEWSEDDEDNFISLCNYIACGDSPEGFEGWIDWLQSIKQRATWKPSDEQMNALDSMLQYNKVSNNYYEYLNSLYNDLKKLKGE